MITHQIKLGRHALHLSQPCVMGILNITPDSFFDGGSYIGLDQALQRAEALVSEGAAILDIGGESTRPGAQQVGTEEELDRVIPVIEKLVSNLDIPISIDTQKPEVMQAAISAGAAMINDVNALQAEGALSKAAELGVPVCLMHMQGMPENMQNNPRYDEVVENVKQFLLARVQACQTAGIKTDNIILDPGFGFGKTLAHNMSLLKHLDQLSELNFPLLVGISRKSMLGKMLATSAGDRPVEQRLHASLAAGLLAIMQGAKILRVHDVGPTVDALKIYQHYQAAD